MIKISKFDAADYLITAEAVSDYLAEAFETGDQSYIRIALDTAARAKAKWSSQQASEK